MPGGCPSSAPGETRTGRGTEHAHPGPPARIREHRSRGGCDGTLPRTFSTLRASMRSLFISWACDRPERFRSEGAGPHWTGAPRCSSSPNALWARRTMRPWLASCWRGMRAPPTLCGIASPRWSSGCSSAHSAHNTRSMTWPRKSSWSSSTAWSGCASRALSAHFSSRSWRTPFAARSGARPSTAGSTWAACPRPPP
jgi:hypothetical protein